METIFDSFIDLQKSFQKVMPLAAIWLISPVITSKGRTARIEGEDKIRVVDGWIVNIQDGNPATHESFFLSGNIGNTILEMDIKDLKTGELSTLKLK
jgi:hypothetical protein